MSATSLISLGVLIVALGVIDRSARAVHGRGLRQTTTRPATACSARSSGSSTGSAASTPKREQRWNVYAISLLAFSLVSVLALYLLPRLQGWLPFNPTDRPTSIPLGRVQRRGQLRDQHQLAVVLGRGRR